ncbi:hypothetical protein [Dawidia soli]|uniref:Uncharacterized protein n=1 Tax=Dawidia soli TaxID=2782352 RepID=A0AAP2GCK9_9BACT|nr:hypothetical protein [Dawidia soli]MBT1686257.1 hypothetical protein [Dawidia soli]
MMEDPQLPTSLKPFRNLTGAAENDPPLDPKERQLQYLDNAELFEILNAEYMAYKAFHQSVVNRVQTFRHP